MANFLAEGTLADRLGFDTSASPPWTMTPLNGRRHVTLASGGGLNVRLRTPTDASALAVREQAASAGGRVFELEGLAPRTVFVDAVDPAGTTQATLEVSVKAPARVATFFGFVFDRLHRSCSRGYDDAMEIIEVANRIIRPQTNVEMFRKDSGGIYLSFETLGGFPAADDPYIRMEPSWDRGGPGLLPCISSQPIGPSGCVMETHAPLVKGTPLSPVEFEYLLNYQKLQALMSFVNPAFDFTIFFVRTLRASNGIGALTGAYTPVSNKGVALNLCIMPDSARGQSLAHELCHYLLRANPPNARPGHHSAGRDDLMNDVPGLDSVWIPKDQANVINPSGKP